MARTVGQMAAEATAAVPVVRAADVQRRMREDPNTLVIDVRDSAQARLASIPGTINIGYGEDVTIGDLARLIGEAVGYTGSIVFDAGKPDGTPRKLMDTARLQSLGWRPTVDLRQGLARVVGQLPPL